MLREEIAVTRETAARYQQMDDERAAMTRAGSNVSWRVLRRDRCGNSSATLGSSSTTRMLMMLPQRLPDVRAAGGS